MAKKKGNTGRPTLYGPEILEKAKHYIENFAEYGDLIPSAASLALELGIHRSTLYHWAKQEEKKEFSDILERCNQAQERTLLNKGLGGEFNATIVKLALGKHGYTEKTETNSSESTPIELHIVKPND